MPIGLCQPWPSRLNPFTKGLPSRMPNVIALTAEPGRSAVMKRQAMSAYALGNFAAFVIRCAIRGPTLGPRSRRFTTLAAKWLRPVRSGCEREFGAFILYRAITQKTFRQSANPRRSKPPRSRNEVSLDAPVRTTAAPRVPFKEYP
jgi:hypothetical protein